MGRFSEQRRTFADELHELAAAYSDEVEESGSLAGALHRGWMSFKDTLARADMGGVLDSVEQGSKIMR